MITLLVALGLLIACMMCVLSDTDKKEQFMFKPEMNLFNPTILGVPIQDKKRLFSIAAAQGGLIPIQAQRALAGNIDSMKGKTAYEDDLKVIANTAEMNQTQDSVRRHLAAAMTNYIPADGLPNNSGLWYQRNFMSNLQQPGFDPSIKSLPMIRKKYPGF